MTVQEQLIDKAKEAFVLAIEIYNKPSIKQLNGIILIRMLRKGFD
jgi:hypothetical protein